MVDLTPKTDKKNQNMMAKKTKEKNNTHRLAGVVSKSHNVKLC